MAAGAASSETDTQLALAVCDEEYDCEDWDEKTEDPLAKLEEEEYYLFYLRRELTYVVNPPRISPRSSTVCNLTESVELPWYMTFLYVTYRPDVNKATLFWCRGSFSSPERVGKKLIRDNMKQRKEEFKDGATDTVDNLFQFVCPEEWETHYWDGLLPFDAVCNDCYGMRTMFCTVDGDITHVSCLHCQDAETTTPASEFAIEKA